MKMNQELIKEAGKRIIVPLDFSTLEEVEHTMTKIYDHVSIVKIGLEVIYSIGARQLLQYFANRWPNTQIFVDAKLKDISNTLRQTVKTIVSYDNVAMINVYADSGIESVKAVVEMVKLINPKIVVLGLTILTSIPKEEAERIYRRPFKKQIFYFAQSIYTAGCDGLICAAEDLHYFDEYPVEGYGRKIGMAIKSLVKVTPGIRPAWSATDDQKRIATPEQAIIDGSDYLVIGRPITRPPSEIGTVANAFSLVSKEIARGLEARAKL